MFKKQIFILLTLWAFLLLSFIAIFKISSKEDNEAYQNLMAESTASKDKKGNYKAQQQRFNVNKHLLVSKGPERLQMRLNSPRSDLIFEQTDDKTEIVEHFKDVHCTMQENLIYTSKDGKEAKLQADGRLLFAGSDPNLPSSWTVINDPKLLCKQAVRQIDAVTASYHYRTEDLFAEQVKLNRFIAEGNQLTPSLMPLSSLMSGTAKTVQLSLSNNEKPFKAQEFQATFQEWGKKP